MRFAVLGRKRNLESRCRAAMPSVMDSRPRPLFAVLEDADDYKAFEAGITADYDAQSAVERELVLRLASILWRLRRATAMETGLFEIQAKHLRDYHHNRNNLLSPPYSGIIHAVFERANPDGHELRGAAQTRTSVTAEDGSKI